MCGAGELWLRTLPSGIREQASSPDRCGADRPPEESDTAKGRNPTGFACCANRKQGFRTQTPEVTAVSRNGDEQVREEVMAYVREKTRDLSLLGLSAERIVDHIDGGGLNNTERELLWRIARVEVSNANGEGARPAAS
jgi:hypothetical protein